MVVQMMETIRPRLEQSIQTANTWFFTNCRHAYSSLDTMTTKTLDENLQSLTTTFKTTKLSPQHFLYGFLALITLTWALSTLTRRLLTTHHPPHPSTPDLEKTNPLKPPPRKPGTWSPSPFTLPPIPPHPSLTPLSLPPLPYRPFRPGPKYNITLGLRPMPWTEWLELDNQYLTYHALKARRISERGSKCIRTAPEARDAAWELVEEVGKWLGGRWPGVFGVEGGRVRSGVTGEEFNIMREKEEGEGGMDPMEVVARLIQEDVAIMIEREDGEYYLLAGAILLPGFWRLSDKFGMRLSEIHTSGEVPQFREKLEKGMRSFFRRLKPESPMVRNNYFIQVDEDLAWSRSIGDEDQPDIGWDTAEKDVVVEKHMFRTERQTLRRLPKTGAIVFTIRTYLTPITALCADPYVPWRLASAIRSWGDDVSRYKGRERYGDVLLEYLDRRHAEQVEGGLDMEREEEERGYPF